MLEQTDHGLTLILTTNRKFEMADAKLELFKYKELTGAYYFFENEGDVVDTHYHGTDLGHICVVLSGQVKCESIEFPSGNWEKIVSEGEVLDMPDEQWHKITALKPNTKIMNINKFFMWSSNGTVIGH